MHPPYTVADTHTHTPDFKCLFGHDNSLDLRASTFCPGDSARLHGHLLLEVMSLPVALYGHHATLACLILPSLVQMHWHV